MDIGKGLNFKWRQLHCRFIHGYVGRRVSIPARIAAAVFSHHSGPLSFQTQTSNSDAGNLAWFHDWPIDLTAWEACRLNSSIEDSRNWLKAAGASSITKWPTPRTILAFE